tara:strand:+ start:419 stop:754 length:336 start_codon:yes stop_codon:yes gene_type:complete
MNDLATTFPNASPDFLARNSRQIAKLERPARDAPLDKGKGQKGTAGSVHIRFTSIRKRLLDPDNISEKWTLDALRFANIICGDEPDKITLETTQRKIKHGEEEKTLIEVFQ